MSQRYSWMTPVPRGQDGRDVRTGFLIAVAVLALGAAFAVTAAYMEARTYERLTGRSVSTWDALWVELRVQAGPR